MTDEIGAIVQRLAPSFKVYFDLAVMLQGLDKFEDAARAMARAVAFNPGSFDGWRALGFYSKNAHRLAEAEEAYSKALAIHPDHVETRFNRAHLHLMAGELDRGLTDFELRTDSWPEPYKAALHSIPRWDGRPTDKRVVIFCEQGRGDIIHFARYFPTATRLCPNLLIWTRIDELRPMLSRQFGRVLNHMPTAVDAGFCIPSMSLPLVLGLASYQAVPCAPYLTPDATAVARWSPRVSGADRLKIGVAWRGGTGSALDRYRTMGTEHFAPLADVQADFYSLQLPSNGDCPDFITDLATGITDFEDTAAIIAQLDLVITVDTAVAHLAGALGKPVWILLSWMSDWRWMLDREDTPWYPTARLFRQPTLGDWGSVMERVRGELQGMTRAARAS